MLRSILNLLKSKAEEDFSDIKKVDDQALEQILRRYAIYDHEEEPQVAPMKKILKELKYKQIGMGFLGRAYKILGSDWVFKEARWDLSLELFANTQLPLPAKIVQAFAGIVKYQFLPRKSFVLDQYRHYMDFSQYFGYFDKPDLYYHPKLKEIYFSQRDIRNSLLSKKNELEWEYKFKMNPKIDKVLRSKAIRHNFLPKEYQLYGKSISPSNKRQLTSFIFQKFINGDPLYKINLKELKQKHLYEVIVMLYMILLMHKEIHILPDTRPRFVLTQAYNWLTKTDNIFYDKEDGFKFVDTRWVLDTKANFFQKNMIAPQIAINVAKDTINNLLKYVE